MKIYHNGKLLFVQRKNELPDMRYACVRSFLTKKGFKKVTPAQPETNGGGKKTKTKWTFTELSLGLLSLSYLFGLVIKNYL